MTDVNVMRESNDDVFLILPEHRVGVVADGMGSPWLRSLPSKLLVTTFTNLFAAGVGRLEGWPFPYDPNLTEEENQLVTAVRIANRKIFDRIHSNWGVSQQLRTTVVAALFDERAERVAVAHSGDSRCYRLRGDEVTALTVDHTVFSQYGPVLEDIPLNLLSDPVYWEEDDVPEDNVTRALGSKEDALVDVLSHATCVGDVYLLCSDGLSRLVTPDRLREVVDASSTLEAACAALIAEASSAGGDDDITVVLARVEDS
jgi:protein phosphatase